MVIVRATLFSNIHKVVDQSKQTDSTDQFEWKVFIETGTKQSVADRLGREMLQQCKICEK